MEMTLRGIGQRTNEDKKKKTKTEGKANVVIDALSRKSTGSLAHISTEKRPLTKELHELYDQGLQLEILESRALQAHLRVRMGTRLCVLDVDSLKKEILNEAHCTAYIVHPGSMKMCHDLKGIYWWNGMKKDMADYHVSIEMAPYEALYGRKCKSLVCWEEVSERKLAGPELVQITSKKIPIIRERLKITFSRQKSYSNPKQKHVAFILESMYS
eukprot:XP_015572768.1 uncharacterized protein LOC107260995 [Ricinus communis]